MLLNDDQFYNVLTELPCNVVFYNKKLVEKEGKSIRKMVKKLPLYIYMDSPILPALHFIESFFYNGQYGFIDTNDYSIFVTFKRSIIFIVRIVEGAKNVINNYFKDKSINYVDDLYKKCNISEICRIDNLCAQFVLNRIEDLKINSNCDVTI